MHPDAYPMESHYMRGERRETPPAGRQAQQATTDGQGAIGRLVGSGWPCCGFMVALQLAATPLHPCRLQPPLPPDAAVDAAALGWGRGWPACLPACPYVCRASCCRCLYARFRFWYAACTDAKAACCCVLCVWLLLLVLRGGSVGVVGLWVCWWYDSPYDPDDDQTLRTRPAWSAAPRTGRGAR